MAVKISIKVDGTPEELQELQDSVAQQYRMPEDFQGGAAEWLEQVVRVILAEAVRAYAVLDAERAGRQAREARVAGAVVIEGAELAPLMAPAAPELPVQAMAEAP